MLAVVAAAEALTFEAGHVLKIVLKLWSNLKLNILMYFVFKKKSASHGGGCGGSSSGGLV